MDAIEAMELFLSKIEPSDPHPDVATAAIEMRVGRARGSFRLSDHAAKALVEALARYGGPDEHAGQAAEVRRRFAEEVRNRQLR